MRIGFAETLCHFRQSGAFQPPDVPVPRLVRRVERSTAGLGRGDDVVAPGSDETWWPFEQAS